MVIQGSYIFPYIHQPTLINDHIKSQIITPKHGNSMVSFRFYNVRFPFLVISWDEFCLKSKPSFPGSNFVNVPENLGTSGYQQHMPLPIKLSTVNHTYLCDMDNPAHRQLMNDISPQRMVLFSSFIIKTERHRAFSLTHQHAPSYLDWSFDFLYRYVHVYIYIYIYIFKFQSRLHYLRLSQCAAR